MLKQSYKRFILLAATLLYIGSLWAQESKAYVAGYEHSQLSDELKARVLFEELSCVSCHDTGLSEIKKHSKRAPRLAKVGERVNPYYLESFIAAPEKHKPGTSMPNLLSQFDEQKKQEIAKAITQFLLSKSHSKFSLQAPDKFAVDEGMKLFHSVGCVSCHSPRDEYGKETLAGESVPLGDLEKKFNVRSLSTFLRNPNHVRPSGRMPNMHLHHSDYEKIAHYLLQKTKVPGKISFLHYNGNVKDIQFEEDVKKINAGIVESFDPKKIKHIRNNSAVIYETWFNADQAGDYKVFLKMNGGRLKVNGKVYVEEKGHHHRGVMSFQAVVPMNKSWNKVELIYLNMGRNPELQFSIEGPGLKVQAFPLSKLNISKVPIEPYKPYSMQKNLIESGKKHFANLGCASCHTDVGQKSKPAPTLISLKPENGCLSDKKGHWPKYTLSNKQKELLNKFLPKLDKQKLNAKDQLHKSLASLNCIACHKRDGVGEVKLNRDSFFTSTHPELGNEGRKAPPLNDVGAKLNKNWLHSVLTRGERQREYVKTIMPQYGAANVEHLVDLFVQVDSLKPVKFEPIQNMKDVKVAGRLLVGGKGFTCIACHDFNGQKSAAGALEITNLNQRMSKEWFYHYMINPQHFRPGIIMPSYWPGGMALRKDILGGDTKKQVEAIWHYLNDGKRAKAPEGLSRQSPELLVADEAIICRGRGTEAGYRAIAVGYPNQVNLVFDTDQMNLTYIWKGEFARAGHSQISMRGRDRLQFESGIPFHRLKKMEDYWPYKGKKNFLFPQDHGYQFRGYDLDHKQRPTFMYDYGNIKIRDFFEDKKEKGKSFFTRTIQFEVKGKEELFYFRAASGKNIDQRSDTEFKVQKLNVKLSSKGLIRQGAKKELLVPLELPQGKSELTIEYHW